MSLTLRRRRLGVWLAAVAVLASITVSPAALASNDAPANETQANEAQANETQANDARRAANWIAAEYAADDSQFEAFLPGVLADIVYALAVAGTNQNVANAATDQLAASAAGYIGAPGALRPGAAGKVVLTAVVQRRDPATFVPGRNVEAELRAAMGSGATAGRFADDTFNQSLAILGLAASDGGVPGAAATWLVSKQCPAGDFTYAGTCPGGDDQDTTALAAQALFAAGRNAAAAKAVNWLAAQQNPDGSFGSYGANANTTGVAAQALRAGGKVAAADKAAGFIATKLQFAAGAGGGDAGGIRWMATDTEANGFATIQGILAYGAPRLDQLLAPDLSFTDVPAGSTFAADVEWLVAAGITRGCNPPANDQFCPKDPVSRGQMSAFLVRALDLKAVGDVSFVDTVGHVFETDIEKLATARVTRGCNPPLNDRFCPSRSVTRAQMAAFVVRALDLKAVGDVSFVDTTGSIFETDIKKLATAGITYGCNPPANDRFCPDRPVTREQMAAFLRRALG